MQPTWCRYHVELNLPEDRVVVGGHPPSRHPLPALDQQLLLLPAQDADPDGFVRPQRDFAATSSATSHVAIVAEVADAVRELGLQADLTCCFQLDAGLLLSLGLGLDLLLEADHLVLLRLQELDLSALLRLT